MAAWYVQYFRVFAKRPKPNSYLPAPLSSLWEESRLGGTWAAKRAKPHANLIPILPTRR